MLREEIVQLSLPDLFSLLRKSPHGFVSFFFESALVQIFYFFILSNGAAAKSDVFFAGGGKQGYFSIWVIEIFVLVGPNFGVLAYSGLHKLTGGR